jgi:hypothetical protein
MSELTFQYVFVEFSSSFLQTKKKKKKKENLRKEQFVVSFSNICQAVSLFASRKLWLDCVCTSMSKVSDYLDLCLAARNEENYIFGN